MPDNKSLVRRLVQEVWCKGKLDVADQLVAQNYVGHDPVNPPKNGLKGFKEQVNLYRTAFPDLHLAIQEMLVDGNTVVYRWTARGTHKGELMGIPPTGKQATCSGITICRISRGKIAQAWANWDALGLMQQIGAVPRLGETKKPAAAAA